MTKAFSSNNNQDCVLGSKGTGSTRISGKALCLPCQGVGLTAAGTILTDALALTSGLNYLTTVANGTGVRLPDAAPGAMIVIVNNGANTVNVWPPSATGIVGLGATPGNADTLNSETTRIYYRVTGGAAGQWAS